MDPGGGAGIRTLGAVTPAGFQDQCFRPLSHPSGNAIISGTEGISNGAVVYRGYALDS